MNTTESLVELRQRQPSRAPGRPGLAATPAGSDDEAVLRRRVAALLECSAQYLLGPGQAPVTVLRERPPRQGLCSAPEGA